MEWEICTTPSPPYIYSPYVFRINLTQFIKPAPHHPPPLPLKMVGNKVFRL